MHAVTAVNQQANSQGLVGKGGKIFDRLRLPVFQNLKVVLLKIGNQQAMLVLHGKNHIHQVHVLAEDRNIILAIGSSLPGRSLLSGWWSAFLRLAICRGQEKKCERKDKK